jgi:arylsulfatase A-like enzyme
MVESIDESVGRVFAKLEELGLASKTVVIFTSDNGARTRQGRKSSVAPLRGEKSLYYEGGIRIPLVVRWPGVVQPGSVCSTPVISTDFYPTFLQMSGQSLRPGQHRDGVSLVPVLRGAPDLAREALFWHFPHYHSSGGVPCGAMRQGKWKLLEFFETGNVELYDLEQDRGEQHNLAQEQPERAAAMRQRLAAWRREVDAQVPQ